MSFTIFKHYLFRAYTDIFGLLIQIAAPILIASIMSVIGMGGMDEGSYMQDGFNVVATGNFLINLLIFQFMSGGYISEYIHNDFKSDRRWRLLATPVSLNKYVFSALAACVVYSLTSSLIVMAFGYFVFNVYMGNIIMILVTLLVTALLAQFMGFIIGLCTKTNSSAMTLVQVVGWSLLIFSGFFISLDIGGITDFLGNYSPFSLAVDAFFYSSIFNDNMMSDALNALGLLSATTAVIAIVAWIIGRRRPV